MGGRNRSTTTATHIFSFFSPCIELEAQLFPPLPTDLSVWTSFSQCVFAGFEFPAKHLDSIQCSERRSKDGIARQLSLPPIFPFRFPQIDPFTLMCKRREGRNRATGEGHENRKLRVVREKSSLNSNLVGASQSLVKSQRNQRLQDQAALVKLHIFGDQFGPLPLPESKRLFGTIKLKGKDHKLIS